MRPAFLILLLVLVTALTRCSFSGFTGPENDPVPVDDPAASNNSGQPCTDFSPAQEEEAAALSGYWRSGSSYYMEIGEEELIIRDSMKRPVVETGYEVMKCEERLYLVPEDDSFNYNHLAEPYATLTELYWEDGRIWLHFYHHYMPDELKEQIFEATDEGPFDNILIRDDEFLEELQGRWQEDPPGFYILTIDGNHITAGYESDGEYIVLDEMDFHVISYTYWPENVYLIKDDLIETEFYAFSQFQYQDGKLCTNEMVLDADWDTSIDFVRADE